MLSFSYRISVLIPVYNAEATLDRTMQSLFAQTMPAEDMQILLINDGSADGSGALCDKYAKEHDNIKVIHQENAGVSAARNAGIRAADGKYILYLDGDDTLSPVTLKNIADYFDKHYSEIDLVTYPLIYHFEDGHTAEHWRTTQYLKNTGTYTLKNNPCICQTTINVCVKNNKQNPILFNTDIELAEDQLHNTTHLSRTAWIGFVREAAYNYFVSADGAASTKKYSPHAFCDHLYVHNFILDIGDKQPDMKRYCENIVLYNFNWKIEQDCLFPYYLEGKEYESAVQKIYALINRISSRSILAYPHMSQEYKFALMSMKTSNRPVLCANEKEYALIDNSGELFQADKTLIVVTNSRVKNGKLYILAHAKCIVAPFDNAPLRIFAVINSDTRVEIDTFTSMHSHYFTNMLTNNFSAFHFETELENISSIGFEVELSNHVYPTTLWFKETQGLKNAPHQHLTDGTYKVSATQTSLSVEKGAFDPPKPKANRKITACRRLMGKSKKRIWLYNDRDGIFDNAYYQFKHDFKKKDGIKRYYVYDEDIDNIKHAFTRAERKHLIRFASSRHKILYSNAEYVLTSFVDAIYFRPFDIETFAYYRGVCSPEVVYLQHGILHAKTTHYSKERLEVDKVVISGEYERELFARECGFQDRDLIPSGMPRLDQVNRDITPQKKILYAPSWRTYLTAGQKNRAWQPVPNATFKKSKFFTGIVKFLNDTNLLKTLEASGYSIEFKLHPIFKMYEDLFREALPNTTIASGGVELGEYAALITDFSSFLYDFAYLKRPIFYYLPDPMEFRSGANHYRELYIPFEKGLGQFSSDSEEMAAILTENIANGFRLSEMFSDRFDKIFYSYEPTHARTLYQHLVKGDEL